MNEVYPWSPTVKEHDRANIHLYRLIGYKNIFLEGESCVLILFILSLYLRLIFNKNINLF